MQRLGLVSLLVSDYDEAIAFYTRRLGFKLAEDTFLSAEKRWVVVQPGHTQTGCSILLAKAATELQIQTIGKQSGGRVFLFLYTDDLVADYRKLLENDVQIIRPPRKEPYGTVLVFADLYGNLIDLIEPA